MVRYVIHLLLCTSVCCLLIATILITQPLFHALAVAPVLMLGSKNGPPTTSVKVQGTGFGTNENISIDVDTTQVGTALTTNTGAFDTKITIPTSALPGNHSVQASGQTSGITAQKTFLVQTNWPMYGFDQHGTHDNPYENVLNTGNVSNLTLDWKVPTSSTISSSPAVVNGIVYIGSGDGHFYAINATTGKTLWMAVVGGGPNSPCVANGIVYASGSSAGNNSLYAFHAATGKVLWTSPLSSFSQSPPTVLNGILYIGTQDGNVNAFNATTGGLLWKYTTDTYVDSSLALAQGTVYVNSNDTVYALSAQSGTLQWSYSPGDQIDHASPSVANGVVYIGSANHLSALNMRTGTPAWVVTIGHNTIPALAIANRVVYYGTQDLRAFNASTGVLLWTVTPPGGSFITALSVANNVVYADAYMTWTLYAYNAGTGEQLWSYTTGNSLFSSPAIVNGMVYVGSFDHNLYAFHLG